MASRAGLAEAIVHRAHGSVPGPELRPDQPS